MTVRCKPDILLCGACYSSNLGDGVIADCLTMLLKRVVPECQVNWLDLSGRDSFAAHRGRSGGKPSKRGCWHARARVLAGWCRWRLRHRESHRRLCRAELVIFGGGQLLMDNNLHFPLRISTLASMAHRAGVPVAWHACGVNPRWSPMARQVFRKALAGPMTRFIALRDHASRQALSALVGTALPVQPQVTIDPAVCAAEAYGVTVCERDAMRVGLGVTCPNDLQRSSPRPQVFEPGRVFHFWVELAQRLRERGLRPVLFTNGGEDDAVFAEELAGALSDSIGPIGQGWDVLPRPIRPRELVEQINSFGSLVAHRLHANIVGFALGVPRVGLAWDEKVRAFAQEVGQGRWVLGEEELVVERAAELVQQAISEPVCNQAITDAAGVAERDLAVLIERSSIPMHKPMAGEVMS